MGTGSAYIMLGWNSFSDVNGDALDKLRIAHWHSSQWNNTGSCTFSGNDNAGTLTTQSAISNFSPFTLSSTTIENNLLPITLKEFTARAEDQKVILSWKTATELNNAYFILERSNDGLKFEPLSEITGSGTTHETRHYQYIDATPLSCRSYYRLKQVDFDGRSQSFNIVAVNRQVSDHLQLFPNPVSLDSELPVRILLPVCNDNDGLTHLSIYRADGCLKWSSGPLSSSSNITLSPRDIELERGIYMVNVRHASKSFITKMVIH
jgi:hypothetical protein